MDIYSIGGGEIIYEVLKAVALCLNGGSGTLEAMLRIGGFAGAFIVYYMILYGSPKEIIKSWGIPVLLITNMLFVPTATVWVKDTITHYSYKIDKVPYGLALFASQISKLGKAITDIVEQSFSTPDDMKYQKTGMMFGSDILEKAKTFRITNSNFKENMRNFVGQCIKYDIMLNHKYSFDDLRNTDDIWSLVTSNPSRNRGLFWIPIDGKGRSEYVTCEGAVNRFNQIWGAELDRNFSILGRQFFTGKFVGYSGSSSPQLQMSPEVEQALKLEMKSNLTSIYSYLGEMAGSAEETLKQALMINAIQDGASENSKMAGNALTYAEVRALQQQNNTFDTIGRLATKLLPLMKAVIEALAYACFIFIIPLCMIPSGYKFLINWIGTLIWLQAWPPMYAILNYIMNIAARASTLSAIGTAGGLTIGNYIGVSEANTEMKLLAGYLSMSIPFICIAIVKGVGNFVHLASQMTGTSMQAASMAAGEVSSGNFSYGNVSVGNQSYGNVSQLQRNFSSLLSAGGHTLDTGGMQIKNDANGFAVVNRAVSSGINDFAATLNDSEEFRRGYMDSMQRAQSATSRLSELAGVSRNETKNLAHSLSRMTAQQISHNYGFGAEKSNQVLNDAKVLDQIYTGHTYTDQTKAGGNVGISGGASVGTGGKGYSVGASAGLNGGVEATNATNSGDSQQTMTSQDYAEAERRFNSAMQSIANSNRNDDVTRLATEHTNTLSKMNQLGEEKAYHENMAKSYQASYSKASNLTVSERMNLRDYAIEIAGQENIGPREASMILDSNRPEDQAQKNRWFSIAQSQERARRHPTMPMMKQPMNWGNLNKQTAQNEMRQEFSKAKQAINDDFAKHQEEMTKQQKDLSSVMKENETTVVNSIQKEDNFRNTKEQIKNKANAIKQKEQERSEKWNITAAWDKLLGKE